MKIKKIKLVFSASDEDQRLCINFVSSIALNTEYTALADAILLSSG